jgi:alpha-tubulin suppressor-like RCC1 family protein
MRGKRVVSALVVAICVPLVCQTDAYGVTTSVTVFRWGSYINKSSLANEQDTPTAISFDAPVKQIATSNSANYALLTDGTVWAFGDGSEGQLGSQPPQEEATIPVEVQFPSGVTISSIGTGGGDDTDYAIDTAGGAWAWAWGSNDGGDLCVGDTTTRNVPTLTTTLPTVTQVSGASNHVLWLTDTGTVYACGTGQYGELGTGSFANSTTPVLVQGLPPNEQAVAVSTGRGFSGVLMANGSLYEFGNNSQGQLGDGKTANASFPTRVPGTFSQIYLGGDVAKDGHVLAITRSGVVEAWGCDSSGQLGNDELTNESRPVDVDVPNGVTFSFVAAGGEASAAIDTNGNLWTWGSAKSGQLGNAESSGDALLPIAVDHGVEQVQTTAHNVMDLH